MKKILFIVFFTLFLTSSAFATDACDQFLPVNENFYWKVTIVARLRDYPCINKSTVIWSSKLGDTYKIVRKVDWWYEVQFDNWTNAWIRDQAISKLYDYTPEIVVENKTNSWYSLTIKDKVIINKIVFKVNLKVKEEGIVYRDNFIKKVENIILKYELTPRLKAIFNELLINLKEVTIIKSTRLSSYNIDFEQVKNVWLSRNNSERKLLWKYEYKYNDKLEETAFSWSETMKTKNEITHKRNSNDSYYNYWIIANWFSDRWIVCKNVNKVTFSENIWQWVFLCKDSDCTQELIDWIRSSFDFYMSEKTKSSRPHYLSLVNDYFKEIWLWIALTKQTETKYKYYLTVHYCTEIN